MGLNTGGQVQTTAPSNLGAQSLALGNIGGALQAGGGLGAFATPSSLYQLTPAEQTFQNFGMGLTLPGASQARALNYVMPGSPAGNLYQRYFQNFTAPTILNNAIASGYGGRSGAALEALTRGGEQAAMQGLTSFGAPMATQDIANAGTGMGFAGAQRQASLQDFGRIQQLLQSLTGQLPTTVPGGTTTMQGPGLGAMLTSLLSAGLLGGGGGPLISGIGNGLGSLASGAGSLFKGLFSGGTDNSGANFMPDMSNPAINPATASNFFAATAPDASLLTDIGANIPDASTMALMNLGGGGATL